MHDPKTIQYLWAYMIHADGRLIEAAASVPEEGYFHDQGISLGSVHNLLVHCASAQEVWLRRLNGLESGPFWDPKEIRRDELAGKWTVVHQSLLAFAAAQTPHSMATTIRSKDRAGRPFELPLGVCMLHVSDHATYHRVQLNSMINLAGGTPSRVMLISYARQGG